MPIELTRPANDATKAIVPHAKTDKFWIGTQTEFIAKAEALSHLPDMRSRQDAPGSNWAGGLRIPEALRTMREGDASAVAKADTMMRQLEDAFPAPTARKEWTDDVVGAMPNVPAFLSGSPMNMRRKRRVESEAAPLAVVVCLGSSAFIKPEQVHARGIAILALVRALAAKRPVELWVGNTAQGANEGESSSVYFRIETAPLDLQHGAHLISHPSISRLFCYSWHIMHGCRGSIPWQYGISANPQGIRDTFPHIIKNGFPHLAETLAIPMIHSEDAALVDPVEWIKKMVRAYTEEEMG